MMKIKRREFLRTLSAGATGSLLPGQVFGQLQQPNELKIPSLLSGEQNREMLEYALTAQLGESRFLQGFTTPTMGFNGAFLGPTLRLQNGKDVSIAVDNQLGEATTVHWHGLHVPANVDGGPAQVIDAGDTWNVQFRIMQKAGTFWYHSHVMSKTGSRYIAA